MHKSEKSVWTFSVFEMGSGANPPGGAGDGGGWESLRSIPLVASSWTVATQSGLTLHRQAGGDHGGITKERRQWPAPDSEQFRSTPSTRGRFRGILSLRQTGTSGSWGSLCSTQDDASSSRYSAARLRGRSERARSSPRWLE